MSDSRINDAYSLSWEIVTELATSGDITAANDSLFALVNDDPQHLMYVASGLMMHASKLLTDHAGGLGIPVAEAASRHRELNILAQLAVDLEEDE